MGAASCTCPASSSQVEGQPVEVDIAWDRAYVRAVARNLVREHTGRWDLYCVVPVVIVKAQGVREIQNGLLRDARGVFRHVEMSWLHRALSHTVGHEEKVEHAVYNL